MNDNSDFTVSRSCLPSFFNKSLQPPPPRFLPTLFPGPFFFLETRSPSLPQRYSIIRMVVNLFIRKNNAKEKSRRKKKSKPNEIFNLFLIQSNLVFEDTDGCQGDDTHQVRHRWQRSTVFQKNGVKPLDPLFAGATAHQIVGDRFTGEECVGIRNLKWVVIIKTEKSLYL